MTLAAEITGNTGREVEVVVVVADLTNARQLRQVEEKLRGDETIESVTILSLPEIGDWEDYEAGPGAQLSVISRLRILPVGPFGRASTISTRRGYLYAATLPLT